MIFKKWYDYDENNNCIRYKDSDGFQILYENDKDGNRIHSKSINGLEVLV